MKQLIIITGCSKGLGRALMEKYIRTPETQVIGVSRSALEEGPSFRHVQLDLEHLPALEKAMEEIFPKAKVDKVVLINNAGWIGEIAPIGSLTSAGLQSVYTVNVIAPALLMNEFVRKYAAADTQKLVVNISSGAADKSVDGWAEYSSTKAALNRLTLTAQYESEHKELGITYYAVSPGIVDTPMQEDIRQAKPENFSSLRKFKGFKENQELSSPAEAAEKIMHLIQHPEQFDGVLQDIRDFSL